MRGKRNMIILGIETSCDETAASVVKDGTKILSNVVASSVKLHKKTGGIIPEIAAREQIKCIIPVIEEAIENCKLKIENLDSVAVTFGPGLVGSLLVGIETAKTLAFLWKKPIVPVNHLLSHIYANFLDQNPQFPAVCLIASGGHTELLLMKSHGKFKHLGATRDDASGEAFDKIARLLGLGFPGGPAIEQAALKAKSSKSPWTQSLKLPRPMIKTDDFDFSFSGLKTAVLRNVKKLKSMKQFSSLAIHQLSFEVQEAITDCLVKKTIKAARKTKAKSVLLSGGVAANKRLREKARKAIGQSGKGASGLFAPSPSLCTDNAASVASFAFFNFRPLPWKKINARPDLGPLDIF